MRQARGASADLAPLGRFTLVAIFVRLATLFFSCDNRRFYFTEQKMATLEAFRAVLDDALFAARGRTIGPYEKLNWDGRRMRCVSNILFDDHGKPAGMLCINFNIAVFEDVRSTLDLFIKGGALTDAPAEDLFRDDWQDRINTYLHNWLRERQIGINALTREHKREIVEALHAQGAFRGRSSANYVAAVLTMGRATVYKILKQMKEAG